MYSSHQHIKENLKFEGVRGTMTSTMTSIRLTNTFRSHVTNIATFRCLLA